MCLRPVLAVKVSAPGRSVPAAEVRCSVRWPAARLIRNFEYSQKHISAASCGEDKTADEQLADCPANCSALTTDVAPGLTNGSELGRGSALHGGRGCGGHRSCDLHPCLLPLLGRWLAQLRSICHCLVCRGSGDDSLPLFRSLSTVCSACLLASRLAGAFARLQLHRQLVRLRHSCGLLAFPSVLALDLLGCAAGRLVELVHRNKEGEPRSQTILWMPDRTTQERFKQQYRTS
mmetsp:Transcript_15215/g.45898  ORF Transcript_15215/g.45898 Transcript_15215/m.45898 type:complete len:233 (+) Transcript_15215:2903-3601(+)